VAQFRAGRRVGTPTNCRDVLSPVCRRRHAFALERLDRFDQQTCTWHEVVVADRRFTPADAAATKLDFAAWLSSLTVRNRLLAEKLATGETTSDAARLFGVSRGRVSQLRRELYDAWRVFQNETCPANG
jgi:hypothetical protein